MSELTLEQEYIAEEICSRILRDNQYGSCRSKISLSGLDGRFNELVRKTIYYYDHPDEKQRKRGWALRRQLYDDFGISVIFFFQVFLIIWQIIKLYLDLKSDKEFMARLT